MADPIDSKALEELADATDKVAAANEKSAGAADKAASAFKDLGSSSKDLKEKAKDLIDSVDKLGESLSGKSFTESKDILINEVKKYFTSIDKGAADSAINIALTGAKLSALNIALAKTPTSNIFASLNKEAQDANSESAKAIDSMMKLSGFKPDTTIGKFLTETVKDVVSRNDQMRQTEMGLYRIMAASGQLNRFTGEVGIGFENMEKKLLSFNDLSYTTAQATGLSADKVAGYAQELLKVPNGLDKNIQVGATREINALEASLKVATGTGLDYSKVVDIIGSRYNELNSTTQSSLEYISRVNLATQNLKIPFGMASSYVDATARSLRFFGDNTQASINILERLTPAFRSTGLSINATSELVKDITSNISSMGLAERAYLSQSTGGPGGLRGSYQIEQLKAEGKFDQIQKMTEESLKKQFGGRVVSLKEATQDEGAARQLAKQVQLVTQGPTKVVRNEEEAYKLFEAMQKGISSPELITGQQALTQAVDAGSAIQERQTSQLTLIQNALEQANQYAAITSYSTSRQLEAELASALGLQGYSKQKQVDYTNLNVGNRFFQNASLGTNTQLNSEDVLKEELLNSLDMVSNRTGIDLKSEISKGLQNLNIRNQDIPNLTEELNGTKEIQRNNVSQTVQVEVQTICQTCQKKIAQNEATKVFNKGMKQEKMGDISHMHNGISGE